MPTCRVLLTTAILGLTNLPGVASGFAFGLPRLDFPLPASGVTRTCTAADVPTCATRFAD